MPRRTTTIGAGNIAGTSFMAVALLGPSLPVSTPDAPELPTHDGQVLHPPGGKRPSCKGS